MQAAAMTGVRFYIDGERVSSRSSAVVGSEAFVGQRGGGELDGQEGEGSAATGAEAPITLKVRDQSGEEMVFRVKRNTVMKKIFDAYAARVGVNAAALKFSFDGERVKDEDTPKMLELNENDQIDVFINQTGGGEEDGNGGGAEASAASEAITIKVKEPSGEDIAFKVKKSTKLSKIMEAYATRKGVALNQLRFMVDGKRVNPDDTPKFLEMEDGDQIDVRIEQQGGR